MYGGARPLHGSLNSKAQEMQGAERLTACLLLVSSFCCDSRRLPPAAQGKRDFSQAVCALGPARPAWSQALVWATLSSAMPQELPSALPELGNARSPLHTRGHHSCTDKPQKRSCSEQGARQPAGAVCLGCFYNRSSTARVTQHSLPRSAAVYTRTTAHRKRAGRLPGGQKAAGPVP